MRNINVGDIFSFKLDSNVEVYFQFLGKDTYQLNSDCIAFFEKTGRADNTEDLEEILRSGVWFITLTWLEQGIKDRFYKKIYTADLVVNILQIRFKSHEKDFYSNKERSFKEIFYVRDLNSNILEELTEQEFNNLPDNVEEDGATLAQGLKRYILSRLYN